MYQAYFTLEQREALARAILSRQAPLPERRRALEQLRDPGYGLCSVCGEAIPFVRLLGNPGLTRCRRCDD
jgi:RNA polymerase-binding transcription factor DksA